MSNTSEEITINVLVKKRAELMAALERNQTEQAKIIADLGTVDSALFMFAPHIEVQKITPKQLAPIYPSGRGEMTALSLSFLREAKKPISTQDLNIQIMMARNLNTNDAGLVEMMRVRLHSTLRNHRTHGRVRSIKSEDRKFSLWEIVR